MSRVNFLPWLLHSWLLWAATSVDAADFAAESLLKYSTAENRLWNSERWKDREEAVGQSQKHEQYLPAPPQFLRDSRTAFSAAEGAEQTEGSSSNQYTFGLKNPEAVHSSHRDPRQQFSVSFWCLFNTLEEIRMLKDLLTN